MPDESMERHQFTPPPEYPVEETHETVAYLGVRLPKSQNDEGRFVPSREQYADYINDKFSLGLQKDIAVSWLQGDPILIEGGTSIGKTTTVRKMAADLGWEVHYANLNGATDVEDLMGRYIPNPDKRSSDDPEYIFADGKVTSGLRQEDGKVKVIILDEFNSAAPNIVIRLHEVLDAINRGESVVLSEDASESIPVNKETTKVVALMNPPGKGYFGREPLDPAQLRRWVYLKAPSELPDDTFSYSTDALFTLAPQEEGVSPEDFLVSQDYALQPEQLQEIPGIDSILGKYKEFHKAAKELVKGRRIAADQPQPFTYDDRMEPRRVRDFILRFYNGDVNETFQSALRYYYSNKLDSEVDKQKLEELIRHVEYIAPQNVSPRRGFDRSSTAAPERQRGSEDSDEVLNWWKNEWTERIRPASGFELEFSPPPFEPTREQLETAEREGFEYMDFPKLNLGKEGVDYTAMDPDERNRALRQELQDLGVRAFLERAEKRYPGLRRYESLSSDERNDHSILRWPEEWYWDLVKDGKTAFPDYALGGRVLMPIAPKPSYGEQYSYSEDFQSLLEDYGLQSVFNCSYDQVDQAMDQGLAEGVRHMLGVEGQTKNKDVMVPHMSMMNLAMNFYGWGSTNTYEWTNTEARVDGESCRVIVGNSAHGGAANALWHPSANSNDNVGFRVAVVLGT